MKSITHLALCLFITLACQQLTAAERGNVPIEVPLLSGAAAELVGVAAFTNTGRTIDVDITMVQGYSLRSSKIHLADSLSGFPVNGGGNIQLGQFALKQDHADVDSVAIEVLRSQTSLPFGSDQCIAVYVDVLTPAGTELGAWAQGDAIVSSGKGQRAAYAVVYPIRTPADFTQMPTSALTLRGRHPYGTEAYWRLSLLDDPGIDMGAYAAGDYPGWCIQKSVTMRQNTNYSVQLYSSLNYGLPEHLADLPWNKLNYIINHVPADATYNDVQSAIWYILGDVEVNEMSFMAIDIADQALLFGDAFIVGEGDRFVTVADAGVGVQLVVLVTWFTPADERNQDQNSDTDNAEEEGGDETDDGGTEDQGSPETQS